MRREREDRERPRSRVRDSSRQRRDPSPSRRDRESERDRDKDRDEHRRRDDRRDDHLRRDRDGERDNNDDHRRWRDDGKRDERMAARRELRDKEQRERERERERERGSRASERDSTFDSERPRDRERDRWTVDERDAQSKRTNGRDRRRHSRDEDRDGKDRDERKDPRARTEEKEPAWMDTYIPSDSGAGILGGKAENGELDGIQAWKLGMKEKERKERESEALRSSSDIESAKTTEILATPPTEPPLDEIQLFKLMIKREEEKHSAASLKGPVNDPAVAYIGTESDTGECFLSSLSLVYFSTVQTCPHQNFRHPTQMGKPLQALLPHLQLKRSQHPPLHQQSLLPRQQSHRNLLGLASSPIPPCRRFPPHRVTRTDNPCPPSSHQHRPSLTPLLALVSLLSAPVLLPPRQRPL